MWRQGGSERKRDEWVDPAKVRALCFERRGTGPTMHKLPWASLFFGIVGKLACDLGHSTHQVPTQWLIRHLFFRHCWENSHVHQPMA